jgi:hypothetical protein
MKTASRMIVAALLFACAGCQQYVSSPGVPTARGIPEDPNKPAAATVIVRSVQYIANTYPPGSLKYDAASAKEQADIRVPYACIVNLPRGMRKSFYERIAEQIGPECRPMSPEVQYQDVPVFHVTRVWMRFNSAIVDVLRPMPELGPGPDGKPIYQMVTVRLEGGTEPWHVIHVRAHAYQDAVVPAPYFIPQSERTDQFAWQKEQDAVNPHDRGSY